MTFIISCKKTQVIPVPVETSNIKLFSKPENALKNGDNVDFYLIASGVYTLTMIDTVKNQIVSRERFSGKTGINTLKIYTNSLPTKYLSVELRDQNNQQIGKTRIIIN